jgi:hypothetical protein
MKNSKKISKNQIREKLKENKLLGWVLENVKTPKGEKLDFYNHGYLVDIYDDTSQKIIIKKAAQVGVTTFAMNKALWFADTRTASVIYTFPTLSDVSDFSRARLNPMIRASPYLSNKESTEVDSVQLKQIEDSFLYIRGAWAERQAISVDSDFNIHDEVDFSKPDIIDMYQERMSHSDYGWFLALSTPTIPKFGIDYLFNRSDKKEWFITCPECKHEQILTYPDSIKGTEKKARYICKKCGATVSNETRRDGEWRATGDEDWGVSGYHISQLMAPWISATEIMRKKEKAEHRPTKELSGIKDFYNFVLGEAFGGENQPVNRDLLLSCIQNKENWEERSNRTIMGVDQGDILHAVIFRKNKNGTIKLLWADELDSFEDIPDLMDKYGVIFCMIDALPNKHSVRDLQRRYPGKVWMCYYSSSQKEFVKWKKDREDKEWRVITNKIESLDRMASKFQNREIVLPKLDARLNRYISHMTNWAKDKEEKRGGRIEWVYKKLGADHFTMATNYAMLGIDKLSTGSLAEPEKEDIPKRDKPITSGIMDMNF